MYVLMECVFDFLGPIMFVDIGFSKFVLIGTYVGYLSMPMLLREDE